MGHKIASLEERSCELAEDLYSKQGLIAYRRLHSLDITKHSYTVWTNYPYIVHLLQEGV